MSSSEFVCRHNGPRSEDIQIMLKKIGIGSLDDLIQQTIPGSILLERELRLPEGMNEQEYLDHIRRIAAKNKLFKTYIGLGYYGTVLPAVIQRNILENPGWYTSYTPYQAEISQGRLEALLNFQTMIMDLTGMEVANASLLDEPTAAAEAMIMMFNLRSKEMVNKGVNKFFTDRNIFPQTLDLLKTRSKPLNIELVTGDYSKFRPSEEYFGALLQYPGADGKVNDYSEFMRTAHSMHMLVGVAADLLSLTLLKPPGEWGADIVIGSTQRFGIPMGYGGPHAAYFASRETFKRNLPGRIIGVSVDRYGKPALRMALQTREQHIKREKATSNICTSQALLASMAGMYAVWHGPEGLKKIALRIHTLTGMLADKLRELGYHLENRDFFDTLKITLPERVHSEYIRKIALEREVNFYYPADKAVQVSLDETTTLQDVEHLLEIFAIPLGRRYSSVSAGEEKFYFEKTFARTTGFLQQQVFNRYHSETDIMRYIKKLERKDISLTHSMISLGSCTMKLNAAVEMLALSWPEFANLHPFVPFDQAEGYQELINELGRDLKVITGYDGISFMPNSGAAGEYTGLIVIRAYHERRGEGSRNVCLIPSSAHGTNPASAVMAGMKVVVVACDENGNVNLNNLRSLAEEHKENLAAFMITYPSTHGVFEEDVKEMVEIIHHNGGLVYMDGANMNAQVGLTSPALIGADVCHLNLHKTFAIPHGGGGPGMGPITVAEHLVEFLPTHPIIETGGVKGIPAVAGAPWGSALILTISHAYIKLMGGQGLTEATKTAILNANYLAASLKKHYDVLYKGVNGFVAHEMILDCRNFKQLAEVTEADIAKRLMDYGFHAPTLSFPVHGTLMVEPTESESLHELDRFVEAMISIYGEIMSIKDGKADHADNVLKNAPHTAEEVAEDKWTHPYTRKTAAFPLSWIAENKFWPAVGRVDDAHGDRNLVCSCASLEELYDSYQK
ncbi:MAG: glycine dehydrogenase [Bacteroides sp. SM23_62_1]|nr:MAG: glycine dehydrogenase [Bacteroides sp. SM23_62_1]